MGIYCRTVSIALTGEDYESLVRMAREADVPVSTFVRNVLRAELERLEIKAFLAEKSK